MRLYAEVARLSFRRFSTYRGAMLAGAFTNVVFGFVRAAILRSAIASGSTSKGVLTATTATQFVFVGQAMIAVTSLFGDQSLIAMVKSGDVATELHRPWDWSAYRLATDLGKSTYQLVSRAALIAAAGWIAFRLPIPSLGRLAMFGLTVIFAVILASRIWTIAGLAAFWLVEASGVMQLVVAAALFGTGLLVPLQVFPSGLGDVLKLLPFASLLQGPIDALLGVRSAGAVVGLQLVWIVVAEAALRVEMRAAMRRLELQGG